MYIKSLIISLFLLQSINVVASEQLMIAPLQSLNNLSAKGQAWSLTKNAAGMAFVMAKKLALFGLKLEKDLFFADKKAFILFNLLMAFPVYCCCEYTKKSIASAKKRIEKLYEKIKCTASYTLSVVLLTAAIATAYNALSLNKS